MRKNKIQVKCPFMEGLEDHNPPHPSPFHVCAMVCDFCGCRWNFCGYEVKAEPYKVMHLMGATKHGK
jgi:hypothetical protein